MNKAALVHRSDSLFCYALGPSLLRLTLKTEKDDPDIKGASALYQGKFSGKWKLNRQEMKIAYSDLVHDYYEADIPLTDTRVIYVFGIVDSHGKEWIYSESGLHESLEGEELVYDAFQMPYINSSDVMSFNKKFEGRLFYQIFPDRFSRDGSVPHSKPLIKWGGKIDSSCFAGGNIKGITGKLPYIKSLGVGALYLTPVFRADTNHKYDTLEYGKVDPDFGTDEDLIEMVRKAHDADILVVLDLVYNHVSFRNPIFQDVVKNGRKSPYYEWFIIDGDYPSFEKGNYRSFGFHHYMPKLNLSNETCAKHFLNLALEIAKKYDIDGYRLDVSDEIPHTFWRDFRIAFKKERGEDFLIIGEDWHDAESFLNAGDQFDSVMNYGLTREIHSYFIDGLDAETAAARFNFLWGRYKEQIDYRLLNMLSSHDKPRFLTEAGNKDVFLASYAFLLFYPGNPSLYYGDEVGLEGGRDPDCRRCFPWDEENQDKRLKEEAFAMLSLRKSLGLGNDPFKIESENGLLKMTRLVNGKTLICYFNKTKGKVSLPKGNVVLSNLYEDGVLSPEGFAIYLND